MDNIGKLSLVPPVQPWDGGTYAERQREEETRQHEAIERRRKRDDEARAELDRRLTKPDQEKIKAAVLGAKTLCAVLLGPTGVGKTTAARYLVRHNRAVWIVASEFANAERRHGLGQGFAREVLDARDAKALVIDDVGHEKDTSALFEVLDYRYRNGLPIIVTSGLTKDALTAHVSAAGVRRMVDQHCPLPSGGEMPVLVVDCFEKGAI